MEKETFCCFLVCYLEDIVSDAKKQAQEEILKVFLIEKSDMEESESLNIAEDGDDNAILL